MQVVINLHTFALTHTNFDFRLFPPVICIYLLVETYASEAWSRKQTCFIIFPRFHWWHPISVSGLEVGHGDSATGSYQSIPKTPEMENVKVVHARPQAFLGDLKTAKYQRANKAGPLSSTRKAEVFLNQRNRRETEDCTRGPVPVHQLSKSKHWRQANKAQPLTK